MTFLTALTVCTFLFISLALILSFYSLQNKKVNDLNDNIINTKSDLICLLDANLKKYEKVIIEYESEIEKLVANLPITNQPYSGQSISDLGIVSFQNHVQPKEHVNEEPKEKKFDELTKDDLEMLFNNAIYHQRFRDAKYLKEYAESKGLKLRIFDDE